MRFIAYRGHFKEIGVEPNKATFQECRLTDVRESISRIRARRVAVYLQTHCNIPVGSKRAFTIGVLDRWHNCLLIYWRTSCLVPAFNYSIPSVTCLRLGDASNRQTEAIASSWIFQNKKRPGWSVFLETLLRQKSQEHTNHNGIIPTSAKYVRPMRNTFAGISTILLWMQLLQISRNDSQTNSFTKRRSARVILRSPSTRPTWCWWAAGNSRRTLEWFASAESRSRRKRGLALWIFKCKIAVNFHFVPLELSSHINHYINEPKSRDLDRRLARLSAPSSVQHCLYRLPPVQATPVVTHHHNPIIICR